MPPARAASAAGSAAGSDGTDETDATMSQKILKRAEIGKITRVLKDRLGIAQHKIERSWQNLSMNAVATKMAREAEDAARQQASTDSASSGLSGSSSSFDARTRNHGLPSAQSANGQRDDFLVPDLPNRSRPSDGGRSVHGAQSRASQTTMNGHARHTNGSGTNRISPLKRYREETLDDESPEPGSSPLKYHASSTSVNNYGLPSGRPVFTNAHARAITPPLAPSTPPPGAQSQRRSQANFKDSEEGADLLLFLATSPSPARPKRTSTRALEYSSPPPMRGSSAVNTPVGAGFNLSEFLNFTPSPAQAAAHHHAHLAHLGTPTGSAARSRMDEFKVSPTKLTYETSSPSRPAQRLDFA